MLGSVDLGSNCMSNVWSGVSQAEARVICCKLASDSGVGMKGNQTLSQSEFFNSRQICNV